MFLKCILEYGSYLTTHTQQVNNNIIVLTSALFRLSQDTAKDLENLIVYCRSISIKPWSWSRQRETSVSEMFSFGEPSAMKLCKHSSHGNC